MSVLQEFLLLLLWDGVVCFAANVSHLKIWFDIWQYVGWYDDPSLGGMEKTISDMMTADPEIGK